MSKLVRNILLVPVAIVGDGAQLVANVSTEIIRRVR